MQKIVYYRRKREGRTDYRVRLALLKSRTPRLVIRKSNKHLLLQVVAYEPDGDRVIATVTSKMLEKHGWTLATANTPAAYLTGLLLAKTLKSAQQVPERIIVDIGLQKHHPGSRMYAAVKALRDAGIDVACGEEIFPSEDRIAGKHLSDDATKLFETVKKKLG